MNREWWWEHDVCAACEHFKERDGQLHEPLGVQWIEDRCTECGGAWLCCRPCFEQLEREAKGYKSVSQKGE